ncbi:MAG: type III secretion system export apparatus subunit SctU [Candidatus Algichlamydia australiensis]|nr:type III secretion system export apparatus subunit SctU [Chlamydiales bacterium]
MAEKSEKATSKKLRDARKKGQVAKSQDFPSAFTFVASMSGIVILAGYFFDQLAGFMTNTFNSIKEHGDIANEAGRIMMSAINLIFSTSFPFMAIIAGIGIIVGFLVVGPVFSMEAMKPDIKRMNPVENLKNMFKLKTFVELLKSIIKITGAVIIIYYVVKDSTDEIVTTASLPVVGSALVFSKFLTKVALRVGIFFIAIAIFDLVFQKRQFAKQMMMEKFEVKQEMKDTEGNPEIKSKRRQRSQELAYQEGPAAVSRSKVVVTNPVHLAIALEYDEVEEPAPKIATMGQGREASEIIRRAQQHDVPIMRNVPLAHDLWDNGKIGAYIPYDTYKTVAEILKWVASLERAEEAELDIFKSEE